MKPDLFGSYSMAQVAIEARYLFVGLFTEADDDGILIDSPKKLAGAIFPHDEKVTGAKVDAWLTSLEGVGSIARFTAEDGPYIAIPTWLDHQKISHPTPSKFKSASRIVREKLRPEWEGEGE